MNGADVNLASFKGQPILFNFWATWCPPCKLEIPMFTELYDKYKDEGFVVLGFSVDDTPEMLQPFARDMKINYPLLVGLGRDDVQEAFGNVWALPTTFLISRDGRLCKKLMGVATKDHFEKEIKAIL
jgi:peroxiredoxin